MNIFVWLNIILFLLALTDFIFPNQKRFNQQIFYIAWAAAFFVFGIKYYFGPDILYYIDLYESIPHGSPINIKWINSVHAEFGFALYCNILNYLGASFWLMTFIINALYFIAIFLLFKRIDHYKTFALFVIVLFDYGLLACEFRQCMAVALFIFATLCYTNKKHFYACLLVVLSVTMHKSAFLIVAVFLGIIALKRIHFTKLTYGILLGLLLVLCVLPLDQIFSAILSVLPFSASVSQSVTHHIAVAIQFQSVLIVYFSLLLCLAYQKIPHFNNSWKTYFLIALIGCITITFFYRNWFLLNRLRSYFLPYILVYCIHIFEQQKKKNLLLKQLLVCVVFAYCILLNNNYWQGLKKPENKTNETSTIFALRHKSEAKIKAENMQKAKIFWKTYEKYQSND